MTEQSPAEVIFFAALEKGAAGERTAYLDAACGADRNLRQRVDRLLAAHPQVGSFLEAPAAAKENGEPPTVPPKENGPAGPALAETASDHRSGEGVGSLVAAKYKLLEILGQGGMGAVFMAQQTEPVKRLVALKLIKLGMDSKQVLTRFEAERQALALMDHPNIAKVLDAGATDSGRPFFVMELVKGVPITRFCDERQLSPRERLELFIPVCQAIQHAHQKGVIHRDIKPTNVLVALYDDRAVPKVIDFGVAKAAGSQLTDASLVTGFGAIVGTPEYMSPEQAQLNQLDIDTRSDVYALGVLLYELLTGTTPLDRKRLGQDALFEVLRVIREEEPPRPSTRLSTSGTLASIAATRRTEPAKLARLMRGELDWIVMKCLEKERSRRYETANGLARDLERYLHDELVEAQPPSARYRLRKFVRKHRTALAMAATIVLLLVAGGAASTWQAVRATQAENDTAHALIVAEQNQKEADEQRKKAETQAAGLAMDIDLKYCEDGDVALGLLRLADTLQTIPEHAKELRGCAALNILAWGQRFVPAIGPLTHDRFEVTEALLSPDGRTVLTAGRDGTARLWDSLTGKQLRRLGPPAQGKPDEMALSAILQFSKDGSTVMTLHNSQVVQNYGHGGLNTAGEGAVLRLWDVATGQLRAETAKHTGSIDGYSLSQNGSRLATCCRTTKAAPDQPTYMVLRLWNAATGQLVHKLDVQGSIVSGDFSPDGKWVLIGQDEQFGVWLPDDHRPAKQLPGFNPQFSPSGASVASVERSRNIVYWWDTTDWHLQRTIDISKKATGPYGYVYAGFITDDLLAVTNAIDWCQVFVRNQSTPIEYSGFISNSLGPAGTIRPSLDGRLLLIGGNVYDTVGGQRIAPLRGRRFRPELSQFTEGNWFTSFHESSIIDLAADKKISLGSPPAGPNNTGPTHSDAHFLKSLDTCVMLGVDKRIVVLRKADASLDAQLLLQWCRVVTRGMLDERGQFSKFDEPTWEKARQELAQHLETNPNGKPLRAAVTDRLYWLRQEIKDAESKNSPALLPLLDRLVKEEPIWPNYSKRAAAHARLEHWDLAIRDELEAARLTGRRYWLHGSPFSDWQLGADAVEAPGRPREQYELALRWLEAKVRAGVSDNAALRLGEYHPRRTVIAGLALFRLGRHADALATLRRSDLPMLSEAAGTLTSSWNLVTLMEYAGPLTNVQPRVRTYTSSFDPVDLMVRAMCHHHLGQPMEAKACLQQARGTLSKVETGINANLEAFRREAEALIEGNRRP